MIRFLFCILSIIMVMNRKAAFFLPDLAGGGAQRTVLKLARGIAERGYDTDLVLAQAKGPFLSEVPESMRLVDLRASRSITSLPALVRYIRRERPQAMLSALDRTNILALWARRLAGLQLHLVISERNTLSVDAQNPQNWRAAQMPRLAKRYYPWADDIVAVSKGVADDLTRTIGIERERIRVIYNPVITPELKKMAQVPVNHPWFLPEQPPVILAVGRLSEQKDFSTLIRAFALVRANRYVRLLILGEGPERVNLESLSKQLGVEEDVCLLGFESNPYAYMFRSALFVLSSKWEGLPGVLIEALYCGVSLIATDCPGGSREVLADGRYGRLVPVGDVQTLAEAIESALTDEPPLLQRESWEPYELENVVNQYIDVLQLA